MAILAGAIAPALIRYIDKSRKSNDVSSCKTIKTAVETALGNESIYEVLTNCDSNNCVIVKVVPGEPTAEEESTGTPLGDEKKKGLIISQCKGIPQGTNITADEVFEEIATNIGEKTPKVKYKKDVEISATTTAKATSSTTEKFTPGAFYAVISKKGTVYVFIGSSKFTATADKDTGALTVTNGVQICPEIDKEYQ
jgi:type II secretory pathway pseudopilin PulG